MGTHKAKLNRLQKGLYGFLYAVVAPIYRRIIHYIPQDLSQERPPYLVLANHNLTLDPVAVACAFKRPMCFVASDHLQRKGLLTWLLNACFGIISRRKGTVAYTTALEILRTLRQGDSVCLFAEGNRSFTGKTMPILPSTGALAKKAGVPVYTYKIEGAYLAHPRWAKYLRRGKIQGHLVNKYTPEQLKEMSVDEVNAHILEDLREDAHARQAADPVRYRGKRRAESLETILFLCPCCGQIGRLKSRGNTLACACGARTTYTEYGSLEGDAPFATEEEWDRWQEAELRNMAAAAGDAPILQDGSVTLTQLDSGNQVLYQHTGPIAFTAAALRAGERELPVEAISDMSIYGRNTIVFTCGDDYYEVKGDKTFCGRKYDQLYRILREAPQRSC